MRHRRIDKSAAISPFPNPLGELFVVHQTVERWQAQALKEAVEDNRDYSDDFELEWDGNCFFTADFLRAFLRAADGKPAQAMVQPGGLHEAFGPNVLGLRSTEKELRYFIRLRKGQSDDCPLVAVPSDGATQYITMPGFRRLAVATENNFVWRIGHWSDLLVVNYSVTQQETARIPEDGERGVNVDIHPTAVIRRSRIGNNVRIGAYVNIDNAIIEDDVSIEPQASIVRSYLGRGAAVLTQSYVLNSVIGQGSMVWSRIEVRGALVYEESTVMARSVIRSVIGPRVLLSRNTLISDANLDGTTISVTTPDGRFNTQNPFLGCVIGEGARVGTLNLAPGCEIPGGYFLTGTSQMEIRSIAPDLPKGVPLMEMNGQFRNFSLRRPS